MRIAALDDELSQAHVVKHVLSAAGHDCHVFTDARALMRELRRESYDLLVLDGSLPGAGGQAVIRWVRESVEDHLPILLLAEHENVSGIVDGLSGGVDDYVIKPIRRGELRARVTILLNRVYPPPQSGEIDAGIYQFDLVQRVLRIHGRPVDLTQKEYELALFLFRNIGRLLSRRHLLEAVWGRELEVASRTIDTHISRLRTKLALRPENGFRLAPVYSLGYRFERVTHAASQLAPAPTVAGLPEA